MSGAICGGGGRRVTPGMVRQVAKQSNPDYCYCLCCFVVVVVVVVDCLVFVSFQIPHRSDLLDVAQ